jgi:hypothetical protein
VLFGGLLISHSQAGVVRLPLLFARGILNELTKIRNESFVYPVPLASHGCLWRACGFLWADFGVPFVTLGEALGSLLLPWE